MQPATDFKLQRLYWDRVANEKKFSHPLRTDWLLRYLNQDARVLDFGCGYGRVLVELLQAGYLKVVGMDFSEAMLRRCSSELPSVDVVRNYGFTLPLKSNSIDAVILFALLTCIPGDNDQRAVISEVSRVLKPDGCIYISDLLLNDDERNRERYDAYAGEAPYGVFELPEGVVVRHHTIEWIRELTKEFDQLEYQPFTVTTMNGNSSAAFQYLGRRAGSSAK